MKSLHNLIILTKVMMKTSFSGLGRRKGKRTNRLATLGVGILILICFIPYITLIFMVSRSLAAALYPLQQAGLLFVILLLAITSIIFVFGLFTIPGIYYFSKDVETYLTMPLQAEEIVGAKFINALLYEYVLALFILIPAFAGYVSVVHPNFLFYPFAIIVLLLIPIVPLILASLFIMLLMWAFPRLRNSELFTLIISIFSLVIALSFSFGIQRVAITMDTNAMINALLAGNNSLISMISWILIQIRLGASALANLNGLSLMGYIIVHIAVVAVFLLIAKLIYFKGVIGMNETVSHRRRLDEKGLSQSTRSSHVYINYLMIEFKKLYRTPIYMMNCLLSAFIFPILMIFYVSSNVFADQSAYMPYITQFLGDSSNLGLLAVGGLAIGLFLGATNGISASAISREGINAYFMKIIPLPLEKQAEVKSLLGSIVTVFGNILIIGALALYTHMPILAVLILLVTSTISALLINYLSICVDLIRPKLYWENETQAVKQNMNVVITMIPAWGLAAAIVGAYFFFNKAPIAVAVIAVAASIIGLMVARQFMIELAKTKLQNLDL